MLSSAVARAEDAINALLYTPSLRPGETLEARQESIGKILAIRSDVSVGNFQAHAIETATLSFKVLEQSPPADTHDIKILRGHLGQLQTVLEKFDALISLAEQIRVTVKPDQGLNLTDLEVAVLKEGHNLADGHAYRPWSREEIGIISRASEILTGVDRRQQGLIEEEYIRLFFELGGQSYVPENIDTYLYFTASSALEVIGNYLRLNHLSVSLVEPCFDNLADILKRHNVRMDVFQEDWFDRPDKHLEDVHSDVIFLVTPNNPTGRFLSRESLTSICEYCRQTNKLLILDTCFRFYLPDNQIYDQYSILMDSGVDFITVEDTGKTWPTLELKAPFMTTSKSLSSRIGQIYSDFLLHVSPFSVKLMSEFLRLSLRDGRRSLHEVVQNNRKVLYEALKDTFLTPVELPFASISWLRITNGLSSYTVRDSLAKAGVHVLTGHKFFWSDDLKGDKYLRVSLVREPTMFAESAEMIKQVCRSRNAHGS